MKSGTGGVEITLFDKAHENDYPTHPKNAVGKQYKDLSGNKKIEFVFNDLPEGEYAAFAFHDEDDNKKINTNMVGIPTEGYGATEGAKNKFGPPKYKDAKFVVSKTTAAETSVPLKIEY